MMDKSPGWLIAIQLLLYKGMVPSVKIYLSGVCRVLYYVETIYQENHLAEDRNVRYLKSERNPNAFCAKDKTFWVY